MNTEPKTNFMARRLSVCIFQTAALLLLLGCASTEKPAVVQEEDVMLFLKPGLRPESLLFPEYLLLYGLELDTHGRIPQSPLIGVGLNTEMGLKTVLHRYNAVLANQGWQITKAEMAKQSFRLLASMKGETLEIRAVQGTGPTQVFILYKPDARASASD